MIKVNQVWLDKMILIYIGLDCVIISLVGLNYMRLNSYDEIIIGYNIFFVRLHYINIYETKWD